MKTLRWILSLMVIGTFLLTGTMPVSASSPAPVEGGIVYKPTFVSMRTADGNSFIETTEDTIWSGAMVGTSFDVCKVVIHSTGAWFYQASVAFEGTVDGKTGTLQISMVGKRPDGNSEWQGTWVILNGTGELKNLRGQGTFWGFGSAGFELWGGIDYAGEVHFDPK